MRSSSMRAQWAKNLKSRRDIDWDTMFTYVAPMTLSYLRQGEPLLELGGPPKSMNVDYLIDPILENGQATTLYGPGGVVKSYIAAYISCCVQYKIPVLGGEWQPSMQGNVLYLDWESTHDSHNRRIWALKKGLGIEKAPERILYRRCGLPLCDEIDAIQEIVDEHKINLVIVDSQTPASGHGQDAGQVASVFFNALRSLGCTSLIIDHVSKSNMRSDEDFAGPINSVVKFNRSRSVFSIKKVQSPDNNSVYCRIKHTKHNEGRLLEDIGIKVRFIEDLPGNLDRVEIMPCDLNTVESVAPKGSNIREKIQDYLSDGKRHVPADIATAIGTTDGVVKKELSVMKNAKLVANPKRGEWEMV